MPLLIIILSLLSAMFWLMFSVDELLVKETPFVEACGITLWGYMLTIVVIYVLNLISSALSEQSDT